MNTCYANLMQDYLQRAAALLGEPARHIALDFWMSHELQKGAVLERREGVHTELPIQLFEVCGHSEVAGLELHRVEDPHGVFRVVRVTNAFVRLFKTTRCEYPIWIAPQSQYVRLYRYLRRRLRHKTFEADLAPIMAPEEFQRLRDHTLGFLQRGSELLEKYGVAQKRGVILTGEPGNGKTMACRWLRQQCEAADLEWREVTTTDYDNALSENTLDSLFTLYAPGVVLFDDFDLGMRDREKYGATREHSGLLSQLDGVEQRTGVVYLFTTNVPMEKMDPAFLRRGRIDQVIHFGRPAAPLRRRLIDEHWHADIRAAVDVPHVVAATAGLSFAEMDELKKLLVMRFLDTEAWDWNWAHAEFDKSRCQRAAARRIGFGAPRAAEEEANINPQLDPMQACRASDV